MLELVWRRLGDVLDASWAILSALWRPLGDVSGALVGHLGSPRGAETGQEGARRRQHAPRRSRNGHHAPPRNGQYAPRRLAGAAHGLPLGARERAKRAKRAERRHAVASRPRRCHKIAEKRGIQENRERGREEHHIEVLFN